MQSRLTLPPIDDLLKVTQTIAMLDAIMSPNWESRYYSFNSKWSPGQQMASMRDGSGDNYFILFNSHGAILKGFAHESAAARHLTDHDVPLPGLFENVPSEFADFLSEPAFSIDETTFCYWRRTDDPAWSTGNVAFPDAFDPSGAESLLRIVQGHPNSYADWAHHYYERAIDLDAVRRIYKHEPLSESLVAAVNPKVTLADLGADIDEIAYPSRR